MRLRTVCLGLFTVGVAAALLLPGDDSLAAGESGAKADAGARSDAAKPASEDDKYDPDNKLHISRFMEAAAQGNAKAASRDFAGAIEQYRKAIQLQPAHPLGNYLLAEAQLVQGNLAEAEASLNQADNVADKAPAIKVKVLFVLADLKERQKKWDEAKVAWARYQTWTSSHADAGAMPASAAARLQAIDEMLKQEAAYEVVRERIAADRDGGSWSPKDAAK